jgi:hypothetical protein
MFLLTKALQEPYVCENVCMLVINYGLFVCAGGGGTHMSECVWVDGGGTKYEFVSVNMCVRVSKCTYMCM